MFAKNQYQNDSCEQQSNMTNNRVTLQTTTKNKKNNADETKKRNNIFSFAGEESVYNFVNNNAARNTLEENDLVRNHTEMLSKLRLTSTTKEHDCGMMDRECDFCGALHFAGEANNNGLFKSCWHSGKVKLQRTKKYPKMLMNLFLGNDKLSKNFKNNIRSYNSALSFSSLGAQIETISNGPHCFKIHGQVYHNVYDVNTSSQGQKKCSQLYVLDTEMATDIRLQNQSNFKCDRTLMRGLDLVIRDINPCSKAFKNMGEVIDEQKIAGRDVEEIGMLLNRNMNRDQRRYNNPTASEIAMVFTDANGEPPFERDIKVYSKGSEHDNVQLNILSPHLDPMTYALFDPHGESGWQPNLCLTSFLGSLEKISLLQYKVAQLSVNKKTFNPLLRGGKLLQQWIVDSYLQVEANNLNYIRLNQKKLRVDYYKGLVDYLNNGTELSSKPVILPSTFQGSPRNMRERYHDAMAIVTKYGKPDLFVTMTCNPNWKEIKDNLFQGQTPVDRPDLVARVFNMKLKAVMDDILSGKVFGKVVAHVYSIEFQKRGLPHAHILIILKEKIDSVEKIDKYVSAEIPSYSENLGLYEKVTRHMIHGPCGMINPNSPCMESGMCTKGYPKEFTEETKISKDGYPLYRRSQEGIYDVRGHNTTNVNVVPHNRYLLEKYNCHINVEVCTSIKSVKYIFKYIYKGYDCAEVRITDNNEINQYINSRYVSAPEGMWRLMEYKMHDRSHKICRLPVHLPREQMIMFEEGNEQDAVNRADIQQTQLLAWFKLNQEDVDDRQYLYSDIPLHYIFEKGTWKKRRNNYSKIISRIYSVSPKEQERFYLRVLLLNVKGSKSFVDLKSYNGIVYETFEDAAEARGLLMNDNEWERVLEEAASTQTPSNIRGLFGYICAFNQPKRPSVLFEKFYDDMVEDMNDQSNKRDRLLSIIKDTVEMHGWTMSALGLDEPMLYIKEEKIERCINDVNGMVESLNREQRVAFDAIVNMVDKQGNLFFLDGPAGSGKTYLYNAIVAYLRKLNKSTIQMATTGIAADLLEDGRTMHSGMKLPVPLTEASVSRLQKNTPEADRIRNASLILIDEVSMMSKYALDAIDEVLKRLLGSDDIFGGKTVLLGGDFRQTSNIVLKGTPVDIIEASLISSRMWRHVRVLSLSMNMRTTGQSKFATWLLGVGNGSLNDDNNEVEIPKEYLGEDLVNVIYGKDIIRSSDISIFSKVILTTKNEYANRVNEKVLALVEGTTKVYSSADSILTEDASEHVRFPTEFLNKQQPSGPPPHKLCLKVGSVVMLLRNLDAKNGLLNGTRLWIKELHENFIMGEIITGRRKGTITAIPRIDMQPSETLLPFVLKRRQFPVILSYAMTIHKSQGQSFDKVGVYLPEPVFAHGQLYVALSRVREESCLKVYLPQEAKGRTKNIVITELLRKQRG